MSKSARSIFIFGLYLGVLGIVLLVIPNFLHGIFQFPARMKYGFEWLECWSFFLGGYYILAARKEVTDFFQWTVYLRSAVILFFIAVGTPAVDSDNCTPYMPQGFAGVGAAAAIVFRLPAGTAVPRRSPCSRSTGSPSW